MGKLIVRYEVEADHMPANCTGKECPIGEGGLCPRDVDKILHGEYVTRKPYWSKRHKDCPLTFVPFDKD